MTASWSSICVTFTSPLMLSACSSQSQSQNQILLRSRPRDWLATANCQHSCIWGARVLPILTAAARTGTSVYHACSLPFLKTALARNVYRRRRICFCLCAQTSTANWYWHRAFVAIGRVHDLIMAQIGLDHEHHNAHEKFDNGFGANDGWVEINNTYNSSQNQSPIYEHGGFGFIQPIHHGLPSDSSFAPQRTPQPPPIHSTHQQQLLPLIMPSHSTWPSMLTNPASYAAPPVAIPPASAPLLKGNIPKLPAIHATPSPRKTLTDTDRRKMCQYHEDNPSVKQTEIGGKRSKPSSVYRHLADLF